MQSPHYQTGHINKYKLDHDSYITSFGKHDRVICSYCSNGITARVDHKWRLGAPMLSDIKRIIKQELGFTVGNLHQTDADLNSTWYDFKRT